MVNVTKDSFKRVGEQPIMVPFNDASSDCIVPVLVSVLFTISVTLSARRPPLPVVVDLIALVNLPEVLELLCLQKVLATVPLVTQVSTSSSLGHTGV